MEWVCQSRPAIAMASWGRWCSLAVLSVVSLMMFAVRWTYPTLQGAGLQCASCSTSNNQAFAERCLDECLNLSDVEMGIITGPAISISTMLASIPLGWTADRGSRVRIILVCTAVWSIGALATGFADSFIELFLACILIGLGQGGINPCSFSLLGDLFSQHRRGVVFALFGALIYVGYDLGALGGVISEYLSWRITLWMFGSISAALLVPILLLREPRRGMSEITITHVQHGAQLLDYTLVGEDDTESMSADDDDLFSEYKNDKGQFEADSVTSDDSLVAARQAAAQGQQQVMSSPMFIAHWCGSFCRFFAGNALGAWMPVFYRRTFGLDPSVVSLWMTIILLVAGIAGSTVGGLAADAWLMRDMRGRLWLCTASSLFAIPFMIGMLLIPHSSASFACLFGASFFAEMWFGPALAAAQEMVMMEVRVLASSIFLIGAGLGGISPLVIGALNSAFAVSAKYADSSDGHASYDPTWAMLLVIPGFYLVAAGGFIATALLMRPSTQRDDSF